MQSQGSTPLHYISASSSKPCWQSIGPAGISPHIGVEHNLALRTRVCVCVHVWLQARRGIILGNKQHNS